MELDYTFERRIELTRRDSRAEGQRDMVLKLLKIGKLTIEEIAECSELSVAEVEQLAKLQTVQ